MPQRLNFNRITLPGRAGWVVGVHPRKMGRGKQQPTGGFHVHAVGSPGLQGVGQVVVPEQLQRPAQVLAGNLPALACFPPIEVFTQGLAARGEHFEVEKSGLPQMQHDLGDPAGEMHLLYEETEASIESRQQLTELRKMAAGSRAAPARRPNKHERKHIVRFKREQ